MALIEAHALGKSYGGNRAVDELSFVVRPGSITGFLGPNGSGKSTTMRLMLGLDRGDGRTTFDGKAFSELAHPMRPVGTLLEAKPFHPTRKARNHLRMLAAATRIPNGRVDEVIELVGLTGFEDRYPHELSGGMRQRCALARLFANEPEVLLMD